MLAALIIASGTANDALAQITGGVFSPVVTEGHRSAEYRLAFDPDTDAFAQRLHYQAAIDSRFMLRVVVQTRKTADSDADFDFVQGELSWDRSDGEQVWQTGIRIDARVRDRGRPGTLGVNWANQFTLSEQWRARLSLLTAFNVGGSGSDGIALGTRANLYRDLPGGLQAGLEMFSAYGTSSDFADFDEQRHALGPFLSRPLGDRWGVFAGALFGFTNVTPDINLRLRLVRQF